MEQNFYLYLRDNALVRAEHLPELMELVTTKEIQKGEFLLSKGQVCKHSFFIEKGLVRFYSIDEAGKEHIVQFAPENWFISDRGSVYFGQPSAFFMDAIEDTTVVLLDHHFIETASEISTEFRNYNEYLLQNHIRHLQDRINLLIGASAEKRYLDFIKLYSDLTLRVPQWMIASYLGITPESLSRVRKELAKRNFKPN
jgi:CRP/FNR family transcriptional regulator, anaerobic regulatory protein